MSLVETYAVPNLIFSLSLLPRHSSNLLLNSLSLSAVFFSTFVTVAKEAVKICCSLAELSVTSENTLPSPEKVHVRSPSLHVLDTVL